MHRIITVLVVATLLGAGSARGADDPKALIERARRVTGWAAAHKLSAGEYSQVRGTAVLRFEKSEPLTAVFLQKSWWDRQGRDRSTIRGESTNVIVDDGKSSRRAALPDQEMIRIPGKSWSRIGDDSWKLSSYAALEQVFLYHARVMRLEGLLEDPAYRLTVVPDMRINGAAAAGVRVARKGRIDIFLYFDRKSGFLIRTVYHLKSKAEVKKGEKPDTDADTAGRYETRLEDYREVDFAAADEALLKKAGISMQGADLVALLRMRTPSRTLQAELKQRVRELGDDSYAVRERASKDLVALGSPAVPLLREAARSQDREVARRAQVCLKRIKTQTDDAHLSAVAHLLALRQPAGAAAALLDYLAAAPAPVAREVRAALYHLGAENRRPDATLMAALKDRDPVRRAAAAAALGKDGGVYAHQSGRRVYPHGVRHARKMVDVIEGKTTRTTMTLELLDLQYYNRFDDSLFAPPTPKKP